MRADIFADSFRDACSGYTISSVSSRWTIHTKTNTPTDRTTRRNNLAHTATFPLLRS